MSLIPSSQSTEAQIGARRANARRSTGPRTPQGKARSRLNALQHGGYATHLAWSDEALRALGEDPAQFRELRRHLKTADGPCDDPLWAAQTDDLARLTWRRRRLERAWEILAARAAESGEPSELVALAPEGDRLLRQLDSVDRAVDRKTRLLLRLREAEARHRRELLQSARRRVRQQTQQVDWPDDTPTDEDLTQRGVELALLRESSARMQRQDPLGFWDGDDEPASLQNTTERTEEVVENKGTGIPESGFGNAPATSAE